MNALEWGTRFVNRNPFVQRVDHSCEMAASDSESGSGVHCPRSDASVDLLGNIAESLPAAAPTPPQVQDSMMRPPSPIPGAVPFLLIISVIQSVESAFCYRGCLAL